jgi:hypothetical protein
MIAIYILTCFLKEGFDEMKRHSDGFILNRIVLLGLIVLVGWGLYKGYLKYRGPSAKEVVQKFSK